MLTPAIEAYGLPVVIVLCLFAVACVVVLVVDYRRWNGHRNPRDPYGQRAAAKRRHPSGKFVTPTYHGRHRAAVSRQHPGRPL